MEVHLAADMEVDKVAGHMADMVADKAANKKIGTQFCHGDAYGLIGSKLFRPKAYPTCVSSNLCEFIFLIIVALR